jgi:copper chaperone
MMIELRVIDMTCGSCASIITKAVKSVDPNAQVEFDMKQRLVQVEGTADTKQLQEAIHGAGHLALLPWEDMPQGGTSKGCC